MRASPCVQIEAALAERVAFLLQEYGHFLGDPQDLKAKLACLTGLHSKETIARWTGQVEAAQWCDLVTDLLQNHYDPAYRRATLKNFEHLAEAHLLRPETLDAASLAQIAAQLVAGAPR
jgi:tRNA 2-selenouridine synthase